MQIHAASFYLPAGLRKAQAAGIKFTHRSKIRFFAPQGDSLHRFTWTLGMADGHLSAWLCKFHLNRCRGMGIRPQISKISTFW